VRGRRHAWRNPPSARRLAAEVEATPADRCAVPRLALRRGSIDTHSASRTGESGVPPSPRCMLAPSPLGTSALRKGRTHAPPRRHGTRPRFRRLPVCAVGPCLVSRFWRQILWEKAIGRGVGPQQWSRSPPAFTVACAATVAALDVLASWNREGSNETPLRAAVFVSLALSPGADNPSSRIGVPRLTWACHQHAYVDSCVTISKNGLSLFSPQLVRLPGPQTGTCTSRSDSLSQIRGATRPLATINTNTWESCPALSLMSTACTSPAIGGRLRGPGHLVLPSTGPPKRLRWKTPSISACAADVALTPPSATLRPPCSKTMLSVLIVLHQQQR